MKVCLGEKENVKTFESIKCGDTFILNGNLLLKVYYVYVEKFTGHGNAWNIEKNRFEFVDENEKVEVIKTKVVEDN